MLLMIIKLSQHIPRLQTLQVSTHQITQNQVHTHLK
jgi:hypothetical protein